MTIQELEDYFAGAIIPERVDIHKAVRIEDVTKFIESHLAVMKHYKSGKVYDAFRNRLINLKNSIETNL